MRNIDKDFIEKNLRNIRAYTERLNEKQHKDVFLGIRDNRLTFYYKKLSIMDINFDDGIIIKTRKEFTKNETLNKELKNIIENIPLLKHNRTVNDGFLKNYEYKQGQYIIKNEALKGYHIADICDYLLTEIKKLLDKLDKNRIEWVIQCEYATKYDKIEDNLYIVDMEINIPGELKKEYQEYNIEGRFDLLSLFRENKNDKFKIVFIELKSKKDACITGENNSSGINKHIIDMDKFLSAYNNQEALKNAIKEYIENVIDLKKKFKLVNPNYNVEIDYNNPEFWILMDMDNNKVYDSISEIEEIIKAKDGFLIKEMSSAKLRYMSSDIRNNIVIKEIF